jgi:hypothetical protein
LFRRHVLKHTAHPRQVYSRVTQLNPVHERVARLQSHLVVGVPWNRRRKAYRSFQAEDLSHPFNQLPSVPRVLGATSEQQLHHGMVSIDIGVAMYSG